MRVLVVSDIHGNHAALEAVATVPHDAVICLGDIVGYGPQPAECVRWVRAHSDWTVQGNHDRAIADQVPPRCRADFAWLAAAVTPYTRGQLTRSDLRFLSGLPRWAVHVIDGVRVATFHAKPSDPLYGYMSTDPQQWSRELDGVDAELVLVGHTHLPLDLTIGRTRLVNPGSVGQPKDGDPRAAYALLEDGRPSLERMEYPIDRTVAALEATGVDDAAVTVLTEILRTGRAPQPLAAKG
jgi:putative phosphoesterase